MPLSNILLGSVDENHLQDLADNQVPESKTIDYKESLPGNSDSDKKEFLYDVSSFANAAGGDLIYGMREEAGVASELSGLLIDADAEIRRLENIVRDGIKPRIPGIVFRAIPLRGSKGSIIIRIPRSWASPHMVTFKNDSKFYSRNSAGKYQLDVFELRSIFALSETTTERIRNFRLDRLGKIVADETPIRLYQAPKIVLHIIPFGAFNPAVRFDVSVLSEERTHLMPLYTSSWDDRHNFDGYLSYRLLPELRAASSYLQIFRNGSIEAVEASLLRPNGDRRTIPSITYERELLDALPRFLAIQKRLGVEPPFFIMLSLLGVSGYTMEVDTSRFHSSFTYPIDRDTLIIPEIIVENFECNPSEVMRPLFDAIWNAAGWSRSMNYNETGQWNGR